MALFSKLNNVMSTKKLIKQPLTEEKRTQIVNDVIFSDRVNQLVEMVAQSKPVNDKDILAESIITQPRRMGELKSKLLSIRTKN